MYNRYIRSESGSYTRIPQEESSLGQRNEPGEQNQAAKTSQPENTSPQTHKDTRSDSATGFIRKLLDQFHLNHIDTGDLLLLLLIFLLIRENADEELLIALGLLLIL